MTDERTRTPTSTLWFLATLVFVFLLVTGPISGWLLPPVVPAVGFAVSLFFLIRSGSRRRR